MNELIDFYKDWLGFEKYYDIILSNKYNSLNEYNQNERLLEDIEIKSVLDYKEFYTESNDCRIDVPVWFGDITKSKHRMMVFGLEPRDTNHKFNIERKSNLVFGSPFGVDRWNNKSSVKGKPQNRYYRVFESISKRPDTFLIFSDIVKTYDILDSVNKERVNDQYARKYFFKKANESKEKLKEEIRIINPTCIVSLGNDSTRIVKEILPEKLNIISGVRHPANGGETKAKEQINQLLTTPTLH